MENIDIMKIFKKLIGAGIFLTFSIAVCSINSATFSWFNSKVQVDDGIFAESGAAYFAGGDGTESRPFILTNQRHFYNLAWLQYLGFFNEDNDVAIKKQYYFKVNNDIDCNGLAIPPIGTTKYPFIGSFDGNNCTISNYTITDTYSKLESHPAEIDKNGNDYHTSTDATIKYCSIIGTFGVIGSYDSVPSATYDTSIPSLSNLYLDNVTISTKTSNVLVGCFAGYVNATIDNCGVHYVKFNIAGNTSKISSFNNVSEFALIGSYNKEKYSYDQEGGSGTDYGTSTDLRGLYEKITVVAPTMIKKDEEGDSLVIAKQYAIPFDFDTTGSIVPGSGKTSVTTNVKQSDDEYYKVVEKEINASYASTIPVASTGINIGYYSGGEVKVYEDYFSSANVNFDNMKTARNSQISVDSDTEHINKIKTYLKTAVSSTSTHRKGDTAMVLSGTYFGDGVSSAGTAFPNSNDNYLVVKDAKVGSWKGDLFIPARGIWVAPTKPGRFEFVAINTKTSAYANASIAIFRLKRSTPKDYSTGFSNTTYIQQTNFTNDMCGCTIYGGSYAYTPYYYGVDVTQEDIDNGYEFFITKYASDNNNPYIVYLDIGTTGSDGGSSTTTNLGDFDFVTKVDNSLTKIKKYDSSTSSYVSNDSYSKSNVTFKIGNTTKEAIVAFRRLVDTSIGIYYYDSSSTTILTPAGTGTKTSTSKEDCTTAN